MRDIQKSAYAAVEECELEGIKHCSLMPGCVETLVWIRSRVIAMGVATSDSEFVAEKIIEGFGVFEIIGGLRELPAVVERLNGLR